MQLKEDTISTRSAEQLGAALKRIRMKRNTTQTELGKKAGLRQGTISKVEKGAKNTEMGTIFSICAALGLELALKPRSKSKAADLQELFG